MNLEAVKALNLLEGELMRERIAKTEKGKPLVAKEKCVAYWTMQSIKVTHDIDYADWREIRKGDYFQEKDMLNGQISKIKFTIRRVLEYKSTKR